MNRDTLAAFWALLIVASLATGTRAVPVYPGDLDPAVDTYTKVTTSGKVGGKNPFLSEAEQDDVIDRIHQEESGGVLSTDGWLDAHGIATYNTLKSMVRIWGDGAIRGRNNPSFNDHWTVSNPALTGTPGTLQLAFNLSGSATVLDNALNPVASDEWASISLLVDHNPSKYSNGTRALYHYMPLSHGPYQVWALLTDPIPFTYGTPFGIRVGLTAYTETDNEWISTTLSPYFERYGGGTIEDVTVDFLNTASLAGVIIPDDPDAELTTTSPADLQYLVTTESPIPEPATVTLLGLGSLIALRRRKT